MKRLLGVLTALALHAVGFRPEPADPAVAAGGAQGGETPAAVMAKAPELLNYETHSKVFEQVSGFHNLIVNTVNIYILVSGAIWAFAIPSAARIGIEIVVAAFVFHLLVSAAAAAICFGLASTIIQRLEFLKLLGKEYWPTIQEKGEEASETPANDESWLWRGKRGEWKLGKWKLRKQVQIWPLIPVLGASASVLLMAMLIAQDYLRAPICQKRLHAVETAATPLDFDRATFLFNDAGCDSVKASR
jgi:hypothetical protein